MKATIQLCVIQGLGLALECRHTLEVTPRHTYKKEHSLLRARSLTVWGGTACRGGRPRFSIYVNLTPNRIVQFYNCISVRNYCKDRFGIHHQTHSTINGYDIQILSTNMSGNVRNLWVFILNIVPRRYIDQGKMRKGGRRV